MLDFKHRCSPVPHPLADAGTPDGKLAKASLLGEGQSEGGLWKRSTGSGINHACAPMALAGYPRTQR